MTRVRDVPPFPLGPPLDFLRRLWRLDQSLERLSSRMEQRLGITAQQRLVVRCIGQFPGMTAGQLAGVLHVDPGTVSAALSRLEAKALVARRKDPHDNRRVALGLTAKGRSLDLPAMETAEDAAEELLATTPPSDLAKAISVIERFTSLLQRRSVVPAMAASSAAARPTARQRRPGEATDRRLDRTPRRRRPSDAVVKRRQ